MQKESKTLEKEVKACLKGMDNIDHKKELNPERIEEYTGIIHTLYRSVNIPEQKLQDIIKDLKRAFDKIEKLRPDYTPTQTADVVVGALMSIGMDDHFPDDMIKQISGYDKETWNNMIKDDEMREKDISRKFGGQILLGNIPHEYSENERLIICDMANDYLQSKRKQRVKEYICDYISSRCEDHGPWHPKDRMEMAYCKDEDLRIFFADNGVKPYPNDWKPGGYAMGYEETDKAWIFLSRLHLKDDGRFSFMDETLSKLADAVEQAYRE